MEEGTALALMARETKQGRRRPAFIVLTGERVGERLSLAGNFVIGRDPEAQFPISDPGVSWQHALVEDLGERYAVVDLESTNGTYVNGVRVERVDLDRGDKVRIGNVTLRFEEQDETDQAYAQAVSQLVSLDDLTGLYLRRRFDAELAMLLEARASTRDAVGLLAMDLDGIKAINDTHGHLFGAHVIAESGRVIGRELGTAGFACRFGGDEFIAALPGLSLEASAQMAERIHSAVGRHRFEHEGVVLHPGISIGVAAFPEHAMDAIELFKRADAALYEAKHRGRNCIRLARRR
jgi:two-component system, cell cycle response regulator